MYCGRKFRQIILENENDGLFFSNNIKFNVKLVVQRKMLKDDMISYNNFLQCI
jgi:hypothetical protein